jgi:hypothetical protein
MDIGCPCTVISIELCETLSLQKYKCKPTQTYDITNTHAHTCATHTPTHATVTLAQPPPATYPTGNLPTHHDSTCHMCPCSHHKSDTYLTSPAQPPSKNPCCLGPEPHGLQSSFRHSHNNFDAAPPPISGNHTTTSLDAA